MCPGESTVYDTIGFANAALRRLRWCMTTNVALSSNSCGPHFQQQRCRKPKINPRPRFTLPLRTQAEVCSHLLGMLCEALSVTAELASHICWPINQAIPGRPVGRVRAVSIGV